MRFKKANGWMELHEMALLYIALAHGTDHELVEAEIQTGIALLRKWAPKYPPGVAERVFSEVLLAYIGQERDALIRFAAENLRQSLSADARTGILNDLTDVAYADGKLLPLEISFIQALAGYWNLTAHLGPGPPSDDSSGPAQPPTP